jgi:hypothetical protein
LVIIGSAVHSPLSMYYHMRVALSGAGLYPLRCPIDNTPRRLDQTGIHVLHCFAALALSGGCVAYTLAATLFNMSCIRLQWQQEVVPKRNQVPPAAQTRDSCVCGVGPELSSAAVGCCCC